MDDELKKYFEGIIDRFHPKQQIDKTQILRKFKNFRVNKGKKSKLSKTVFKVMVMNKMKFAKDEKLRRRMTFVDKKNFKENLSPFQRIKDTNKSVIKTKFLNPQRTENLENFLNNSPKNSNIFGSSNIESKIFVSNENKDVKKSIKSKDLFLSKIENNEIDLLNPEMFRIVKMRNLLNNNINNGSTSRSKKFKKLIFDRNLSTSSKKSNYYVKKQYFKKSKKIPSKHKSMKALRPKMITLTKTHNNKKFIVKNKSCSNNKINIFSYKKKFKKKNKSMKTLKNICSKKDFEKKLDYVIRMKNKQKKIYSNNDYQNFIKKLNGKYIKKSVSKRYLLQNSPLQSMGPISLKNFTSSNYSAFKNLFNDLAVSSLFISNFIGNNSEICDFKSGQEKH
jgi:hypothetical protein